MAYNNIRQRYKGIYYTLHPQNWTDEVAEVIKKFQDHIIAEEDRGYDGHDGHPNQWTFSGSLLYSITVITTIGKQLILSTVKWLLM